MWALFFVSLFTAYEIVSGNAPAYWAIGALVLAILHARQDVLPSDSWHVAGRAALRPQVHLLVLAGGLGAIGGVFVQFAIAYTATPLLLYWLELAAAQQLLMYDLHTQGFILTRSTLYASIRAASYWVVDKLRAPHTWVRLTPLAVSTAETIMMVVANNRNVYTFAWPSARFLRYATLKASAFVAIPLLEEALATM